MGLPDCQSAVLIQNGPWLCPHRCIGMGSCVKACKFGAIQIGPHHLPIVDEDKFGKVSSVLNIGSQGLIPLSALLGGVAIACIGSLGLIAICAGGFLLISLILFFNKPVREL